MSVGMYVSIQVRTAVKEGGGVNAHTQMQQKKEGKNRKSIKNEGRKEG